VLAGPDPRDPFSLDGPPVPASTGPLRIGWIDGLGVPAPEPEIAGIARAAVAALAGLGHEVDLVPAPFDDPYDILATILACADAAGHRDRTDPVEPQRRAALRHGRRCGAVQLARAEQARADLCDRVRRAMARFDLLATPTVPIAPFPADEHGPVPPVAKGDVPWLAWTPNTYPFNLTGQPAVSVPAGLSAAGIPVGVQLIGRWRADLTVLRAAAELEDARPWRHLYRRVPVAGEEIHDQPSVR
jgi:aspartyl-tRNA(Asn)/glutamyl-tRNA(Gln) amidotransferase subunit A